MKTKNINIILIIIILVLLLSSAVLIIIYNKKIKDKANENLKVEESYYDYYNSEAKINDKVVASVKLPANYLNVQENTTTKNIIKNITDNSIINIPDEVLQTYENEIRKNLEKGASTAKLELNEYIKQNYGSKDIEEYLQKNEQYYIQIIEKDMVYQALANEFNITVVEADVRKYFKELLDSGETMEELKENYGEKLMYKYTLEDLVEKELEKRIK